MPNFKRLTTYYSGLLEPLCQYVTHCELIVTPFDKKGNALARVLYTHFEGGAPELKQPDIKVNIYLSKYKSKGESGL